MSQNSNPFNENESNRLSKSPQKEPKIEDPNSLQYVSVRTQPDITISNSKVQPEAENPTSSQKIKMFEKDQPPDQKSDLKKMKTVSFCKLFRFATKLDVFLMILGGFFSCVQGAVLPLMTLIFADFTENLSSSVDAFTSRSQISKISMRMVYLAIIVLVSSFCGIVIWSYTASRQMHAFRHTYLLNLLYKSASWFDKHKAATLANGFFAHTQALTQAYSNKLHTFFQVISTIISGFAVGFYKGWLVSILIAVVSPIMVFGIAMFIISITKFIKTQIVAYAKAGAISDQSFNYIRTIKSLNAERHEIERYNDALKSGFEVERKEGWKGAFYFAMFNISFSLVYSLAFLIGNYALGKSWHNHNSGKIYTVGDFLAILFGIVTGMSSISMVAPINRSLTEAQTAMGQVNEIVNKKNQDSSGSVKKEANLLKGHIEFRNVTFAYPTAPDRLVLKNVSFNILPGEKFAIVGPSGSGKSTIVQLIQRFYDPQEGQILFDGMNIQSFDLKHYRSLLGLVAQQPILFAETIKSNLLIGLPDTKNITDSQLFDVLHQANLKTFIQDKLENGLKTYVGTAGAQLSGGQKQRISIARSLLRHPKLFLFDEATSALDRQNEKEIQQTIDSVCQNTTSVSIAHRLLTIKNSNQIIVLVDGEIRESGTHEKLMEISEGIYQDLYNRQNNGGNEEGKKIETKSDSLDQEVRDRVLKDSEKSVKGKEQENKGKPNDLPDRKETSNGKKKKTNKSLFFTIYSFVSGKDVCMIIIAVLSCGYLGAVMPFIGFYLGKVLDTFGKYNFFNDPNSPSPPSTLTKDSLFQDGMVFFYTLFLISIGSFIFAFVQFLFFSKVSIRFVLKIRQLLFQKFIYKDVGFFDQTENKPGQLSLKLSKDASVIRILVSNYLGGILQALSSFVIGIVFGFVYSWRMSLLVLACSPVLFINGVFKRMMFKTNLNDQKTGKQDIVQESLNNIKMVKSLNAEKELHSKYMEKSTNYQKKSFQKTLCIGIAFSISNFGQYLIFGITFYFAGVWREKYGLSMENIMVALFTLLFGVSGAAMANSGFGDIGAAKQASKRITEILNEETKIEYDPQDELYHKAKMSHKKNLQESRSRILKDLETKSSRIKPELKGNIEFKNVWFRFPTRTKFTLKDFNLKFKSGTNCGIVGTSGSGKSTIFQLLLRFYDTQKGQILIDGIDIKNIELKHLRSFFGLIKQEPELFNGDVEYNIRYNTPTSAPENQNLEKVSQQANATEFIVEHPEGFARDVGNRGDALSGGQKQRVTIARILMKNPRIFLFDEATSALDSNSEKLVQDAIEKITKNHSSLTIAHRLSTIRHCDTIFVIEKGRVEEEGSYEELIERRGAFYHLAME